MSVAINIGFVPLTDAAPVIIAHEMGFAREEGVTLNLSRELNWSTVRDKLSFGILDGAHVLLPLACSLSLGAGAVQCDIDIPIVLNMNGNAFVANHTLATQMTDAGSRLGDARCVGQALITLSQKAPIRVGVPFVDSMHVTMLRYVISSLGANPDAVFDFKVSSPSEIENLLRAGLVDAFMVGAPWGTKAVENNTGRLMLTSNAIWQGAPEKVLGLRRVWTNDNATKATALTRALYRSANWLADHANASVASEILSRPAYLDMDATTIEYGLRSEVLVSPNGATTKDPLALQFDAKRIGFPWQSSIGWVAAQNAKYWNLDPKEAYQVAASYCRPDIYRSALESIYGPSPSANSKLEGSLDQQVSVAGVNEPVLGPDAFFDGEIFDPA